MAKRFFVEGARNDTGVEQQLTIEADDAGQAEQLANLRGLFVSAIRPIESSAVPFAPIVQGQDWRNSPAHLLLLSKFRDGDSLTRYRDADYWEAALNEKPTRVIAQFIAEAMLEPAELPQLLNYKFKISDLKLMLKRKGLKVSGCKDELIKRLIGIDTKEMSEITKGMDVYRCAAPGMHLANTYLEDERARREAAEQQVSGLLAKEDYSNAVHALAEFEATQVFARGLGIDWKNYNGTSDVESLKAIFNATPTILREMEETRLKLLRPAAGMMLLWGTRSARRWFPQSFETGVHLDGDTVCRMLVFHALAERRLDTMENLGAGEVGGQVEWSTAGDNGVCPECRTLEGQVFTVKEARGMMPHAKCTCKDGCRCCWSPALSI